MWNVFIAKSLEIYAYLYYIKYLLNLSLMIQDNSNKQLSRQSQQLKRFNFFEVQKIQQQIDDPKLHPLRLNNLAVTDVAMIGEKILLLDKNSNQIIIFVKKIQGYWLPYSGLTFKMSTNENSEDGLLITFGQDVEDQMMTSYIKLWRLGYVKEGFQSMAPMRKILVGQIGRSQKNISSLHFIKDMTMIAMGTNKGHLLLFESKNILQYDSKISNKLVDKKQIRQIKAVKRMSETDIYFTTQQSFFWFESISEKRRLFQAEAEVMEVTIDDTILVVFKGDNKNVYEFKGGKQLRNWQIEGEKKILRQFQRDYLITAIFEKRNEKTDTSDKYRIQIMDTKNQYIAYFDTFAKLDNIMTNRSNIVFVGGMQKGQRMIYVLTEKDNSFKIETFFKKSFFNEAWRFAKNQNCQQNLLAEISRLHGDLLYSKNDFANSIKQYIMTLGHVQPSYVIRKFLDVSQIDYLIEYLQKIHERKLAKKQHTALLLNCYVKKQKIQNLSHFLSELSIQSDLFDIQTAIKVCKDLKYFDQAMKLAQQKNKHELFLKILIQDKRDYERALDHIKNKVQMEQKQKFVIEFGQLFMKFLPQKTIQLIKLLVRAHSISQIIRGRQRQFILSPQQKSVLQQLNFNVQELYNLSIITFKKPDQYFRLFLLNNQDLENFLTYLIKQIPKLPHQQIVFHRLIEFYLQMIKQHPETSEQYSQKILENLRHQNKKYDSNHLLALFKMYDFDQGIVTLCKKLGMRDDLLNFYISKNRDQDVLQLCKIHGNQEVNLWIHALKYFVKPQNKKQFYLPDILAYLSQIPNLSPLPILSILSKNRNIPYKFVRDFFLTKLKHDRIQIDEDKQVVKKNMKLAEESRAQFKKLKTVAKPFLSNNCVQCGNGLTFPSIHFMCGHSFHQNCLGGDKQCSRCGYQMRSILSRKQKYQQSAKDQTKLFQTLQERKGTSFEVVAEYLGRGLFKNRVQD